MRKKFQDEMNKLNADKEQMQRAYMMYYELNMAMSMEVQKQSEAAKRLQQILSQVSLETLYFRPFTAESIALEKVSSTVGDFQAL